MGALFLFLASFRVRWRLPGYGRGVNAAQTSGAVARAVQIEAADAVLRGDVVVPPDAVGMVVFAHGGGSGRRNPRNRYVAELLQEAGLGTVLLDLLTPEEALADARGARNRYDVGLLTRRVAATAEWFAHGQDTAGLPLGCFAAGTGSAAALAAAADQPGAFHAIVCRGGRPDLAGDVLADVKAPTLLLAGSEDVRVLERTRAAARRLPEAELVLIPGAGRLFEEPGALEHVSARAAEWFLSSLRR